MQHPLIPNIELPVRSIYCIGRNYSDHAKELGNDIPERPLVFLKPLNSISVSDHTLRLPSISTDVHFEGEIVVAIGKQGKNIDEKNANQFIAGIGVGIDFTARDLQTELKKQGHPWLLAKGLDGFAPISNFIPINNIENLNNIDIKLFKNSFIKQHGNSSEMIFPISRLIAYLSDHFTLFPGDLIFTGTPSGVAKVESGDVLDVQLNDGMANLQVKVG